MKNKTRKVLLGAATVAAVMSVADRAKAATDKLTMTAKIIQAIKVTATQNLNFGSLTESGAGGTLKVDKAGATTPGGGVSVVGANAKQGQFKIAAAKSLNIEITLPKTATVINGAKTMKVKTFKISSAAAIAATPYVLKLTAGTKKTDINVGATLHVGAAQATGTYTGTAVITALYQ